MVTHVGIAPTGRVNGLSIEERHALVKGQLHRSSEGVGILKTESPESSASPIDMPC